MNTLTNNMLHKALEVLDNAYAPYSKYQVACCIEAENGKLYVGVNVENAAFPLTTCAEASAISQMIADGQKKIKSIVIINQKATMCPPCGGCRQRIHEFSTAHTKILLCDHDKVLKCLSITELLPHSFKLIN
tara:strand:+ start:216 stop:611 length:396 start_codon:yes stop_codon:yes gene_type:complete